MAASSRRSVSGRIWALATVIILLIGVYTGGWFYAASLLKDRTLTLLGSQEKAGVIAECTDAEYRGYPFRIGLFCSRVSVEDRNNGVSATFGGLRSAAQVYDPKHVVWELDGPSEIRTGHGLSISSQWESLQSSLTAKGRGVERSSTAIAALKSAIVSSASGQTFNLAAANTEMHLRQNGADLDAAMTVTNASVTGESVPQGLPALTTSADVTLAGKAGLIDGSDRNVSLYGAEGTIRNLSADLGDGRIISLSGPFSVTADGRINGKMKLRVEKLEAWKQSLETVVPGIGPMLNNATNMLSALGGGDRASIDFTIRNGKILVGGFIQVGEIPPI
ncbi:DUF2125 domain-containing protein [Neorhizobium sp. NPDC001467]|uniref:DUF2125 domain-containing protein n=1 Tax=Neorhizobium sp. NPDC001467 TaxID=3390595 RepID=UPI003CFFF4E4